MLALSESPHLWGESQATQAITVRLTCECACVCRKRAPVCVSCDALLETRLRHQQFPWRWAETSLQSRAEGTEQTGSQTLCLGLAGLASRPALPFVCALDGAAAPALHRHTHTHTLPHSPSGLGAGAGSRRRWPSRRGPLSIDEENKVGGKLTVWFRSLLSLLGEPT